MAECTRPEEWKPIAGYEGRYDVSSHGRVRSWIRRVGSRVEFLDKPVLKAQQSTGLGGRYRNVGLYAGNGRQVTPCVHQLVAEAFLGPKPPGHEVAHDDGDGHHNWVENIEWKTPKDNHADKLRHGTQTRGENHSAAKLTSEDVVAIRAISGVGLKEIAIQFGVSLSNIWLIRTRKKWKHI